MSTPTRPDLPTPPPPGRYGPPPPRPPYGRRMPAPRPLLRPATVAIVGGLAVAFMAWLALSLPLVPIDSGHYSVSQVHALCSSGLGQLAQGLSSGAAADCSGVGASSWLLHAIGLGGLAAATIGAMRRFRW